MELGPHLSCSHPMCLSYLCLPAARLRRIATRHPPSTPDINSPSPASNTHQQPLRYIKESKPGRFRMAIYSHLKLLLTAGSLLAAAVANPLNKRFDDDDDDDTPLPLVIWHGEMLLSSQMDQHPLTDIHLQDWATTSPPKASAASAPSPRPSTPGPSSTTCTSGTTRTATRARPSSAT